MTINRRQMISAVVVALLAGGVIAWQTTGTSDPQVAPREILTDTIGHRTLTDTLTVSGELRREELQKVNSPFDGRVSQVDVSDGDQVNPGDVLLSLDGRPAVAVNGDFSFYRTLDVGSDGPDVLQLERILQDNGYDPGTVDRLYTEATRAALREWQIDYGYGGATPEPVETVVMSLRPSNGYAVGDKDTAAVKIGPSVPERVGGEKNSTVGTGAILIPYQSTPIPAIGVRDTEITLNEGDTVDIVLTADPAPTADMQINLGFAGTATGGDQAAIDDPNIDVDYRNDPLENTPIVWPAGAATLTLPFETFTDAVDEVDEDWTITITPDQPIGAGINYDVAPLNSLTVTIVDTTPNVVPLLSLSLDRGADRITEGANVVYKLKSDVVIDHPLDVSYSLAGSATEIDDYAEQDPAPVFTFPAGSDQASISIASVQDQAIESDESLTLTLIDSNDPDNEYDLDVNSVSATVIIEDDDQPTLTLEGGGTIGEGGSIAIRVKASEAPSTDVSVDYSISGTATMGSDYEVLTGTINLKAGRTHVDVIITTIDDDVIFVPSDMIVASWPARVGTVFVDEGQTVQLGQELLTLTEPDFTIKLFANPTDRSELSVGQVVTVDIEAGDQKSDGFISQLDDVATINGSGGETYEGIVSVSDDLIAVDGANVTIEVTLDERVDALVVPRAAVSRDGTGKDIVRVVDPETGIVTPTEIVTGLQDGSFTEIVSGLTGGEVVIVDVTGGQ